MRVKVLIVLAIATVLLLCSAGIANAALVPVTKVNGDKVADALQQQAFDATSAGALGFPVLDGINGETLGQQADLAAQDQIEGIDACPLNTLNCIGSCGTCPASTCQGTTTTFPGPEVNLACPVLNTVPTPVNLESPVIRPEFPAINLAPQATVEVPQVNAQLNCFDINCAGCGCPITPVSTDHIESCVPCGIIA